MTNLRPKIAVAVIVICAVGALLLTIVSNARTSQELKNQHALLIQVHQLEKDIQKSAKDRTTQINEQTNLINCIAQFFEQTDRSNKAIANIRTCAIKADQNGGVTIQDNKLGNQTSSSPAPNSTSAPTPQTKSNVNSPAQPNQNKQGLVPQTTSFLQMLIEGL